MDSDTNLGFGCVSVRPMTENREGANAEIVRVIAINGDVLTVVRAQELTVFSVHAGQAVACTTGIPADISASRGRG